MTLLAIRITNLLSFDDLNIKELKDMNCIVGRNNVGKSNLLKALKFFYNKLEGKEELPPKLYSNYSYKGVISITFDTTRIYRIAKTNPGNKYFRYIVRKLMPPYKRGLFSLKLYDKTQSTYTLSLTIYNNGAVKWSTDDRQTLNLILYLYPFFYIEPRHMDLHEWDSLWDLISRIKSFNLSKIDNGSVVEFFNKSLSSKGEHSYSRYVNELNSAIPTKNSTQKEKILSYIKSGLNGYKFEINESDLRFQSDGTNSFHFIRTFLKILITISLREYITPFVFIDEPELGLHPKMNEILVNEIHSYYRYEQAYSNARPRLFITTHSPNIVKEVIKRFTEKHLVFCFQKSNDRATSLRTLNSNYDNNSFINIFSDNEARLFFSDFIFFVEGETELEIFGNMELAKHFPHMKSVDIYKTSSNVIGERVNPSYSNSAIPHMFLFDADKAWDLIISKGGALINSKKNGNYFSIKGTDLTNALNKYKFGYSKKHSEIANNIQILITNDRRSVKIDLTKHEFDPESNFEEFITAMQNHLFLNRFYINKTTIEGCLIQEHSASIFYEWLRERKSIDIDPILSKVKSSNCLTESMLVDYMRVIFNGKTKTLLDYKSFNFDAYEKARASGSDLDQKLLNTSRKAKKLMRILERKTIKNSSLKKTNGWVTDFLNFAIEKIETECIRTEKSFGSVFKLYFPELYDIIRKLQPDSRGEV